MKPVINHLRQNGLTSVIYLNDILCIGEDYDSCENNIKETIELLNSLGFLINIKKCNLTPSKQCNFLGFTVDSEKYAIELSNKKRNNLQKLVKLFTKRKIYTITEFATLIRKLIAACPAVEYGMMYTRQLKREKINALLLNNFNYDSKMSIPNSVLPDLKWWLKNLPNSFNSIKTSDFEIEIYTAASNSGWGATNGFKNIYGFWNEKQKKYHINFKELLAIKFAVHQFLLDKRNCQVLLRTDKTTALSYVNKMGGT